MSLSILGSESFWTSASSIVSGVIPSLFSRSANNSADKAMYKYRKKEQERHNRLVNLSNAMNQNAITSNVSLTMQRSMQDAERIQRETGANVSAVALQAGATGTRGQSVDLAQRAERAKGGRADYQRQQELRAALIGADQQRRNSIMGANMNYDRSAIQSYSSSASNAGMFMDLLGAGFDIAMLFDGQPAKPKPMGSRESTLNSFMPSDSMLGGTASMMRRLGR